jgi:hypothetical protein
MTEHHRTEVWIGLVEVVPRPGTDLLGSVSGAFVNFLVLATNESEYRDRVQTATSECGLKTVKIEDIEPLRMRLSRTSIDDELMSLAEEIEKRGGFKFGTFHTFTLEH